MMFFQSWQTLRPILGAVRATIRWIRQGYPTPCPHYIKQATLLRHTKPGSLFIETGTYKGATSLYMKRHGCQVATIEIHKPLFDAYSPYLNKFNIDTRLGDSAEILPALLGSYKNHANISIFLDGHYSGGVTGQGINAVPVVKEFESLRLFINKNTNINFTIMVDDVRLFMPGGDPIYPPKMSLIEFAINISADWSIENDIFICTRP